MRVQVQLIPPRSRVRLFQYSHGAPHSRPPPEPTQGQAANERRNVSLASTALANVVGGDVPASPAMAEFPVDDGRGPVPSLAARRVQR